MELRILHGRPSLATKKHKGSNIRRTYLCFCAFLWQKTFEAKKMSSFLEMWRPNKP